MSFLFRRKLAGAVLFLFPRHDYWHPYLPPCLNGTASGGGPYYLDFSTKCSHAGPFDEKGIPFTRYGGKVGNQLYPIDICQYALGHHAQWLATRKSLHRIIFIQQADWLVEKLKIRNDLEELPGFWMAEFDWGPLKSPWPSAMAQGQGISVLTRAYVLTKNPIYLDRARSAYSGLRVPIEQGGVVRYDGDLPFFEEFPLQQPSRILNGAIFALWGVHDLMLVTGDNHIRGFYEAALRNILLFLPKYDLGFWTRYDLEQKRIPHISSAFYQELHVNQLLVMHRITALQVFLEYAARWQAQLTKLPNRLGALSLKILN